MRFTGQLLLGALSALSVSAQLPLAVDVAPADDSGKTGAIGTYRFAMFIEEGNFIRAYFPEELEYTGNVTSDVEVCEVDVGDGPYHLDGCTYNPGSNSIQFAIPAEVRPFGLFFFDLGGFQNPATSQELSGFSVQVLGPHYGVRYQTTEMISAQILPNDLTDLRFVKESGIVGEPTSFDTRLVTNGAIPVGGFTRVNFEDDSLQGPPETDGEPSLLSCTANSTETLCPYSLYDSGSIKDILFGPLPAVSAQKTLALSATGLFNPATTKPIPNYLAFTTVTPEGTAIDTGILEGTAEGLDLAPASFLETSLISPAADGEIVNGATETYIFSVVSKYGINIGTGSLEINLPAEVELLDGTTCRAYCEETGEELTCSAISYDVLNIQRLVITHESDSDYSGKNIIIEVPKGVRNPTALRQSGAF